MELAEAKIYADTFTQNLELPGVMDFTEVGHTPGWWVLLPVVDHTFDSPDYPYVVVESDGACHAVNKPWGPWFDDLVLARSTVPPEE